MTFFSKMLKWISLICGLGMDEEERLVGELAKLQTIMMILEGKEEYEKAAIILKKINKINKKLNDGSGRY